MSDTQAAIDYLKIQSFVKPKKIGMLGFCGGGYLALRLATVSKDIKTVVNDAARTSPTDPPPNMIDFVGQVRVPAQYHFGTEDRVISLSGVKKIEEN